MTSFNDASRGSSGSSGNHFPDGLEVLWREPAGQPVRRTPLLFVHGAYAGAWCWEEHFLDYFAGRGYASYAVSLSGHGGSRGHDSLDNISIDHYVADVARVIQRLPSPPVIIGHSMGGLVAQKYLETAKVPAVVLMSSVPPQGLLGSAFGLAMSRPYLLTDLNRFMGGGLPQADTVRQALFHQPVEKSRLARYLRASQPESHRAIWDMTFFNLPRPASMHKVPMLVLGARHDILIPPAQVQMAASTYGVKAKIFPSMGHAMMLEQDWLHVAEYIDGWLPTQVP
ncbi:MAG: alpha/beta hydrolase [Zoogloea sp.]|nr:alpha/beta hydrolase [Zoogloea sp.]